jgi:hypothetical protein
LISRDLNADGRPDITTLAWTRSPQPLSVSYVLSTRINTPGGLGPEVAGPSLDVPEDSDVSFPLGHVEVADVTGDGRPDALVGITNFGIAIFEGTGTGTFGPP